MHAVQSRFWAVRDYFAPVLRESRFERGRITPSEFVIAGDYLTQTYPAWEWCTGDRKRARDYLPSDKQYLVCRSVPCFQRVSQAVPRRWHNRRSGSSGTSRSRFSSPRPRSVHVGEPDASVREESGSWVVPNLDSGDDELRADVLAARLASFQNGPSSGSDTDFEHDLSEFSAGMQERQDDAQLVFDSPTRSMSPSMSTSPRFGQSSLRTYDCIMTYDKYYQTPRMWLVGYNHSGIPLTPAQVFEDVTSDHVHRTVTMEPFPHGVPLVEHAEFPNAPELSAHVASIHPCKHASVMQKLIEHINEATREKMRMDPAQAPAPVSESSLVGSMLGWKSGAGTVGVERYLVIFLKLMASIVPTIEIDATQSV